MSNNPLVPRFSSCLAVFAQKNVPGLHNLILRYQATLLFIRILTCDCVSGINITHL